MITAATPVRVGEPGLFAPRVGLGTAVLGNFLQAISDTDAVAVISRALASGVRYIDTPPCTDTAWPSSAWAWPSRVRRTAAWSSRPPLYLRRELKVILDISR